MIASDIIPGRPCFYCETRADLPCRHRPADLPPTAALEAKQERDTRKERRRGKAFHRRHTAVVDL